MAITNSCFLHWSEQLLCSEGLTEADHRAIVSRAYYSAYHEALNLADNVLHLGVSNMVGGCHIKLSDTLANYICDDKLLQGIIRRLGTRLQLMHSARVRADYFFDDELTLKDAKSVVKTVRSILNIIAQDIKESAA
jgi:uncharacterized protein (UPF0332 family)